MAYLHGVADAARKQAVAVFPSTHFSDTTRLRNPEPPSCGHVRPLKSSGRSHPFAQFTLLRHAGLGPLDLAVRADQHHFGYSANVISLPHAAFRVDKRRESDVVRRHEVAHVVAPA